MLMGYPCFPNGSFYYLSKLYRRTDFLLMFFLLDFFDDILTLANFLSNRRAAVITSPRSKSLSQASARHAIVNTPD